LEQALLIVGLIVVMLASAVRPALLSAESFLSAFAGIVLPARMDGKKFALLAGLIFVGLFVNAGIFSLATFAGQSGLVASALTAVELAFFVWLYEKLAHKSV